MNTPSDPRDARPILYTPEERARRDSTVWTMVQGILAPLQFLACLISVVLVLRYLSTGEGYMAATVLILVKTGFLYLIMVTGAIWEKVVFGQYLFAPAFFWEDAVSFVVIAIHTFYLIVLFGGFLSAEVQMGIALVAYLVYVINAGQFIWKLRTARLQSESPA
jgi:3-vinyl bacteriochlorophyllide hydratase